MSCSLNIQFFPHTRLGDSINQSLLFCRKKPTKVDDIDDLTPYGKTVITKEMYARDKQKRIERYYRILKMKPPGGSIFGKNTIFVF